MIRLGWVALALWAVPQGALAAGPADGTLLSSEACPANPVRDHAGYVASVRAGLAEEARLARDEGLVMPAIPEERLRQALPSPAEVAEHVAYRGFECRVITYASGGLRVAGLLWRPKARGGAPRPLLLMLRGGNGTFGGMEPWRYWGMHDFLKAGYTVLSTQYRGGPGSEGRDGFGSAGDLDDVRNLVPLARALGGIDTGRVFAHGGSRGGMQLYMLARAGFPLRAMAIRAGVGELRQAKRPRPLEAAKRLMTDYPADGEAAIDRRSAALWAGEIKVPTVLFHGTDDWRADPDDSLRVARGLKAAGTPWEAHFYGGDTHSITLNEREMIAATIAFFRRFGGP